MKESCGDSLDVFAYVPVCACAFLHEEAVNSNNNANKEKKDTEKHMRVRKRSIFLIAGA